MRLITFTALLFAASSGAHCAPSPRASTSQTAPVAVSTDRATLRDLPSSFEAGGVVRARSTAVIASRIMAPVAQVHVRAGDRVRRGAPLVTLDDREPGANRSRAEATLTAAVEGARAAESDVRAAAASLQLARATHERISGLHAKKSATPQELDQAVQSLATAEAQVNGAQARAAAATAALAAARASSEAARVGASYTVLSAPFDGVVTERLVDPGSMVVPGVPLLMLEDPGLFRLEVQLDETRAALVATGQSVSVRLDTVGTSGPSGIAARVSEVARIDAASHSFLVKIDLPKQQGLRSGVFGRATFAGPARRTLTVPASAVLRRGQLTFVFLVDENGVARLRPIVAGASITDRVEVLAGVQDGLVVVTDPPLSLADGARVSPGVQPAKPARPGDAR